MENRKYLIRIHVKEGKNSHDLAREYANFVGIEMGPCSDISVNERCDTMASIQCDDRMAADVAGEMLDRDPRVRMYYTDQIDPEESVKYSLISISVTSGILATDLAQILDLNEGVTWISVCSHPDKEMPDKIFLLCDADSLYYDLLEKELEEHADVIHHWDILN